MSGKFRLNCSKVWMGLVIALAPAWALAGENHDTSIHYRDVTLAQYNPTTTLSSLLITNGGAFAATGTWYFGVLAQGSGWAALSSASNATVATGQYVRIRWGQVGGATNYVLWRGSAVTNLTNFISQGITTQALDWGTNAWSTGSPSVITAAVPGLYLPAGDGYSPTGNMAVRASDVAGLSGSDYLQKTGDVGTGYFTFTNPADGGFVKVDPSGAIILQRPDYGDGPASLTIDPDTFGTEWMPRGASVLADQFVGATNSSYGGHGTYYAAGVVFQSEPTLSLSTLATPAGGYSHTNWRVAMIVLASGHHTNTAFREYYLARKSHSGALYTMLDQGNMGYFTGLVQSVVLNGVTYYPTNGGRSMQINLDVSSFTKTNDVTSIVTGLLATLTIDADSFNGDLPAAFVKQADLITELASYYQIVGAPATSTAHGTAGDVALTNGYFYAYKLNGWGSGTNWGRVLLNAW